MEARLSETWRNDPRKVRDDSLAAMSLTEDYGTRLYLWQTAKVMNREANRLERTAGLEFHRPLLRATPGVQAGVGERAQRFEG